MKHDVTDDDGTPPPSLFGYRARERAMPELLGLIKGIVCDGVVTDGEIVAIQQWFVSHSQACLEWPASVIASRVKAAFLDGIIDEDERLELKQLLQLTVGEVDSQEGRPPRATRLPLNRPYPTIMFADREFCFTGVFAFGIRRRCEAEVVQRGGRCASTVTSRTHYLVVGIESSGAWVGTSHGRKIERAMHLRDVLRHDVAIVAEEHWHAALTLETSS